MKFLLLLSVVLVVTVNVAKGQFLPEVLIHRARDLIQRAEYELHQHHQHGRSHLTQELREEMERIRDLVTELEALERSRHLETEEVRLVEERLLHHENRLAELTIAIERAHNLEIEEGRRAQEGRNRESGLLVGF